MRVGLHAGCMTGQFALSNVLGFGCSREDIDTTQTHDKLGESVITIPTVCESAVMLTVGVVHTILHVAMWGILSLSHACIACMLVSHSEV